jgi:hypothetical protein
MGDQGVMKRGELVGLVLYPVRRSGVAFQARFFRVRAFPRVEGQPKGSLCIPAKSKATAQNCKVELAVAP